MLIVDDAVSVKFLNSRGRFRLESPEAVGTRPHRQTIQTIQTPKHHFGAGHGLFTSVLLVVVLLTIPPLLDVYE